MEYYLCIIAVKKTLASVSPRCDPLEIELLKHSVFPLLPSSFKWDTFAPLISLEANMDREHPAFVDPFPELSHCCSKKNLLVCRSKALTPCKIPLKLGINQLGPEENLIHSLYAGQKVRSHVWLRPYGEAWQAGTRKITTVPNGPWGNSG